MVCINRPLNALRTQYAISRFTVACLISLVPAGCASGAAQHRPPVIRTVQIRGVGCGTNEIANGFIVRPGLVMTVAHILRSAVGLTVDGRPVRVQSVDERMDAALLVLDGGPDRSAEFADPVLSSNNTVLRWTKGRTQRVSAAITTISPIEYSDLRLKTQWVRDGLLIDQESRPGDSGSPVLDYSGRVVGMLFASRNDGHVQGFALAASEMQRLLAAPASLPTWLATCS